MILEMAFLLCGVQAAGEVEIPVAVTQAWIGQATRLDKPGLQRIVDAAAWEDLWKAHSTVKAPVVDFRTQMVLAIPVSATGPGVPAKDADPKGFATRVDLSRSDRALTVRLTLELGSTKEKPRTLMTFVVLARLSKPLEVFVRMGTAETAPEFSEAVTLEELAGAQTLTGTLSLQEGAMGALMLHIGRKAYDLHGVPPGIKKGDKVVVYGRVPKGYACVHMCGTLFQVETMRLDR